MTNNVKRRKPWDDPTMAPAFRFDYDHLARKGFADFESPGTGLVITFRGTGMIDVFDAHDWRHVAFLDFDLQREIHLDSAFGSPFIGLPFAAEFKHEKGVSLQRFDDLRSLHRYGFFVEETFRNGGSEGVWNLDELMMAVALEYAEAGGLSWFRVKPTGDTAPYYRQKYGAMRLPTTCSDRIASIRLGPKRPRLPHVRSVKVEGKTHYLEVATGPDTAWPQD